MDDTPNFITCFLMGGLGNQLFQIFIVLAKAKKHERPYIFKHSDILTTGVHRPTYWQTLFSELKTDHIVGPTSTVPMTNRTAVYQTIREPGFRHDTTMDSKLYYHRNILMKLRAQLVYARNNHYTKSPQTFFCQYHYIFALAIMRKNRTAIR